MKKVFNATLFLFALALLMSMFSCKKKTTLPSNLNDIYCQIYAVDTTTGDTTKVEDVDKYLLTDKTVQFYEDWFGIKPTAKGYQYYDCWIK